MWSNKCIRLFQSLIPRIVETKIYSIENVLTRRLSCSASSHTSETVETDEKRGIFLTPEIIAKVTDGTEESVKKLKLIEFECSVKQQEGFQVPSHLSIDHWNDLYKMNSRRTREKHLIFLFKNEMIKLKEKAKKEAKRIARAAYLAEKPDDPVEEGHMTYGLGKNTLFLRKYDSAMDHYHNSKCIQAQRFENPLIFDLSYHKHMTSMEQKNTAKQLMLSFSDNREHNQPFPLLFCNAHPETETMKMLRKLIPSIDNPDFPIDVTTKNYTELYPKDKLVYLTPHCKTELTHYDSDAVYIVGAIVDKSNNEPLSWAKASKENVKMAKLPLDSYLNWGSGSGKSLTLNSMVNIMLELKKSGNWKKALEHIPQRKLVKNKAYEDKRFQKSTAPRKQNKYGGF
uniref:RNA (guanine-9-)-methyltransferase domain-containing protein 1 n=1 Tax=Evadne anonyx TaxID=141404 RepID=A0A9N6WQH0_9CRUS|nr:EOG090X0D3U [Evadne anonyx]